MARPKQHQSPAEKQKAYRQRKAQALRNAAVLRNDPQSLKVARMPIRYYGGKTSLAEWIITQIPPHTCYVEPFCGGASVILSKLPSKHEVMNDLNRDVINFFTQLRTNTEALIRAIWCTPYAREELRLARSREQCDPLEQARRFYVRQWQSFGSCVGKSSTGWRFQIGAGDSRASATKLWNETEHLWTVAARLKLVQIECDDAFKVIQRFDSPQTVFYLDPPYVHSTRYHNSTDKGYAHEMNDDDHRRLSVLVKSVQGMVLLSGYQSELYDELFEDWHCVKHEAKNIRGQQEIECLWLSPNATAMHHLPMFQEKNTHATART
ncbi:MAG: DNA adenine methylase [Anaerolineae bacterium]|nr:DNA adenine methylase [Anaerolineae bacterium]